MGATSRAAATDCTRDRDPNRYPGTQPVGYGNHHAVAHTVAVAHAHADPDRHADGHSDIDADRNCNPDADPHGHAPTAPDAYPRSIAGGRDQYSRACATRE